MIEENLQRRLEEKQLLLAEEQGHIRLTEEEEADYWVWVQVGEEVDRTELEALELKESEFYEGLETDELDGVPEGGEPEGEVETDDDMPSLFGSDGERYSDFEATDVDEQAGELQWTMGYGEDFGDRVVIDYRPLNAVTKTADQFLMPRIDDILDRMTGSLYFSVLNVKSAYHTIPVAEEDIPKTAFVISSGQYEYVRVPFGMENATATLQRLMTTTFRTHLNAIPYLDDIIVSSNNWEEHLEHLRDAFERVKANHLFLKANKCELGFYSTIYLGHILTRDGVKPDAGKVEAISNMTAPVDVKGVREFLGCTSYC
ncbi:unnamed protein product [Closterium sp. Naga37s-1]|nr:unnamed protein product [Closterium sp. Naga37s-1]